MVEHLDRCVDRLTDERRRAESELEAIREKIEDVKRLIREVDRREEEGSRVQAGRFRLCDME